MPYLPRAAVAATCAHCGTAYTSTHLRRKYCCNSCNVMAAQARKKARDVAPPPPPARVVVPFEVPAHVARHVASETVGFPRRMSRGESDYDTDEAYQIQEYKANRLYYWGAVYRKEMYYEREFWVGSDQRLWVYRKEEHRWQLEPVTGVVDGVRIMTGAQW